MRNFSKISVLLSFIAIVLNAPAWAALYERPGGMIYDSDLEITWIADTNLAKTMGASEDGFMRWEDAQTWVENLTYRDFSDWRLPTHTDPDPGCTSLQGVPSDNSRGFNCSLSEMGHLFYVELGGSMGESITMSRDSDVDLFTFGRRRLYGSRGLFWTGDTRRVGPTNIMVWRFSFEDGGQGEWQGSIPLRVLVVRDGDVGNGRCRPTTRQEGNTTITDHSGVPSDCWSRSDIVDNESERRNTVVPTRRGVAPPTGLSISGAGNNSLRFTWQDNSNNEEGFVIERLLPMTSTWAQIATTYGYGGDTGSRSHTVSIQGTSIAFCYRVRAVRGSSHTLPTEQACARPN